MEIYLHAYLQGFNKCKQENFSVQSHIQERNIIYFDIQKSQVFL